MFNELFYMDMGYVLGVVLGLYAMVWVARRVVGWLRVMVGRPVVKEG